MKLVGFTSTDGEFMILNPAYVTRIDSADGTALIVLVEGQEAYKFHARESQAEAARIIEDAINNLPPHGA